jgi:hypothetical protein
LQGCNFLKINLNNSFKKSTMHPNILLIIIFCHLSVALLQFIYPKQPFELPNHPSNWICTVHIAVATFANYTTSDITERFLGSNREKIIPTVSTIYGSLLFFSLGRTLSNVTLRSAHNCCPPLSTFFKFYDRRKYAR